MCEIGMTENSTETALLSVGIVEDDDEMRTRLAASVLAHPGLQLVAEHKTGREALAGLANAAPDVLLIDLGLPDMSGLDIIHVVTMRYPACEVLVVSVFGDEEHVLAALGAGARGYLLKGAHMRDIAIDIQEIRNGGSPLSPIIARQVLKRLNLEKSSPRTPGNSNDAGTLTSRETEILRTISRGFSYAETAELLGISVQTVHTHLKRIYRKLAVHSMMEAVFEADQRRLL